MKKGRHRRYEEARALKRTSDSFDELFEDDEEPCPECAALPGHDHRAWCAHSGGSESGGSASDGSESDGAGQTSA
ncbi:MAG: hypothetical protein OXG47_05725 [bacterium]|nr:hypothetical protein [bacterium]